MDGKVESKGDTFRWLYTPTHILDGLTPPTHTHTPATHPLETNQVSAILMPFSCCYSCFLLAGCSSLLVLKKKERTLRFRMAEHNLYVLLCSLSKLCLCYLSVFLTARSTVKFSRYNDFIPACVHASKCTHT